MTFQFKSLDAFLQMNGHGPFVWAAYGIVFISVVSLILVPFVQKKKFLKEHQEWQKIQHLSDE